MTATRSGALLLSDLCLEPYKAAWLLSLDLLVLDDSGNITDCALAAASGALRATILPAVAADERGVFRLTGGAKKAGKAAAAENALVQLCRRQDCDATHGKENQGGLGDLERSVVEGAPAGTLPEGRLSVMDFLQRN